MECSHFSNNYYNILSRTVSVEIKKKSTDILNKRNSDKVGRYYTDWSELITDYHWTRNAHKNYNPNLFGLQMGNKILKVVETAHSDVYFNRIVTRGWQQFVFSLTARSSGYANDYYKCVYNPVQIYNVKGFHIKKKTRAWLLAKPTVSIPFPYTFI